MTAKTIRRRLIGRKIVGVSLRPFDNGRGSKATDPRIDLDDGSWIAFLVQETDIGGYYGVELCIPKIWKKP